MTTDSTLITAATLIPTRCRCGRLKFEGEACDCKPPRPPRTRQLGDSWPARHRDTIANMRGPGYDKANELLPKLLASSMIVLTGDRGRGKTQIATWIAYQRGQLGEQPGLYIKAFDLFSEIKESWSKTSTKNESAVMDRYKNTPFLAVDECHERSDSDWENRTLRNVLDHRYDACLPTVIIGNWLAPDDIGISLGASIVDRITETGGVVTCTWPSYRQ